MLYIQFVPCLHYQLIIIKKKVDSLDTINISEPVPEGFMYFKFSQKDLILCRIVEGVKQTPFGADIFFIGQEVPLTYQRLYTTRYYQ